MSSTQNEIMDSHCKHFVIRKKRFCRMTVKSGFEYCGEHQPKVDTETTEQIDSNNSRLRIPCPLDSKHTCFASKLDKHLKKCNAQKSITAPYIIPNVNAGEPSNNSENTTRQLSSTPASKILEVITKIDGITKEIRSKVIKKILHHNVLTEELNKSEYGVNKRKHLIQTSSIIGHLENAALIEPKTCFIEFGAGKGQLSFWLSQVTNSVKKSSILLVERASLRHKLDNKLDKETNNVHRVRADIADLVLKNIDVVKHTENVVGITKHLCGDATDLALRCLINGKQEGVNIKGLVMAFCCHHRCNWDKYVGQQFFRENNLTNEDFDIICGLVSWATCGSGLSREARKNIENNTNKNENNRENELGLDREEREEIGKRCKLLIDYGRLHYLLNNDFICNLYFYVEQSVTLENVCIVAKKK